MRIFRAKTTNRFWLISLVVVGGSLAVAIALFVFFTLFPLDVLDNASWRLDIDRQTYKSGEVIKITANYKKVRSVKGDNTTYIYCKTTGNSERRYDLGRSPATRPVSAGANDLFFQLPTSVVVLPTTCYIEFNVNYGRFYRFEINRTPDFRLEPADGQTQSTLIPENRTTPVNNSFIEQSPRSLNSSYIGRTVIDNTTNPPTVIVEQEPTPASPLDRVLNTVNGTLDATERVVRNLLP